MEGPGGERRTPRLQKKGTKRRTIETGDRNKR